MRLISGYALSLLLLGHVGANADDGAPPLMISLCDGVANTGAMDCVLSIVGQDTCPNLPSSPCFVAGVTCEYNPVSDAVQCWFSTEYAWRLRGFETIENNRVAFKYAPAGPNEPGKTTKLSEAPGGWKKQVCEKRYSCYCEFDMFEDYVMCKKELCGKLELLNVVKAHTNCVGGAGGGTPGPGGPGGE